ncbi:MAG TPA: hypothetical protein VIY29_16990, partial [Ktedonobacteraceae bacterium]
MSPDNNEPNAAWQGPSLHWAGPPPDEGMHPLSYEHEEVDEINSNPPVVPQINEPNAAWQGPSLHWAGPPPDEGMHPLSYEHEE